MTRQPSPDQPTGANASEPQKPLPDNPPTGSGEGLREAASELLGVIDGVGADFRNGVTDPTGSIDEGEVRASAAIRKLRAALSTPAQGVGDLGEAPGKDGLPPAGSHPSALVLALASTADNLCFHAETTGGTAGPDAGLQDAISQYAKARDAWKAAGLAVATTPRGLPPGPPAPPQHVPPRFG